MRDAMQKDEQRFAQLGIRHVGRLRINPNHLLICGYGLVILFSLLGVVFCYTAFISKLLSDSGNLVIDMIKHDYYFCYLFPLLTLPTYAVVYLNWLAFMHFEQN